MITSITASTREIDDPKIAVNEILTALNLEKLMKKNSLGIISCFSEFEETGVLKAICEALPFECIGSTTCLNGTGKEIDQILFSIVVLTSDECTFKTTMIEIDENYENNINSTIKKLYEEIAAKPTLFLSYFPLIHAIGGNVILSTLDEASGNVPIFGTVVVDHTSDYSTSSAILNGSLYRNGLVLGAITGEIDMSFEIASINEEKIRKQKAIITKSNGSILMEINGKPALEYLEEIGLTKEDLSIGLGVVPLVIDHKDGTKNVIRGVFAVTPEGYVVCGGSMPEGASIAIGGLDAHDVVTTTEEAIINIKKDSGVMLSYSCIARYLVTSPNVTIEAEKIKELNEGTSNYLFTVSGGEICPLIDENGKLKNYFHNYTNVMCRIKETGCKKI